MSSSLMILSAGKKLAPGGACFRTGLVYFDGATVLLWPGLPAAGSLARSFWFETLRGSYFRRLQQMYCLYPLSSSLVLLFRSPLFRSRLTD